MTTDVERFLRDADAGAARPRRRWRCCARAAAECAGELLPDARYEAGPRSRGAWSHARLAELLRRGADWERLDGGRADGRGRVPGADAGGDRRGSAARRDPLVRAPADRAGPRARRAARCRDTGAVRPLHRGRSSRRAGVRRSRGRARRCRGAAAAVAGGGTAALLVRGPTGIGKSAFCREVVHRAREGGWRVITVAAAASGAPYGADRCGDRAAPGRRARVAGSAARAHAVDSRRAEPARGAGAAAAGCADAPSGHRRAAACACAAGRLLADRAVRRGRAPVSTRRPPTSCTSSWRAAAGIRCVVMLAYRAEWMRTSLAARHHRARRAATARCRCELGPLDDGEIAELVALAAPVRPGAEAVARIVGAAQGSPFFALELDSRAGAASADALPQTVREAITERLVGLDATTMDALTALAVADEELDLAERARAHRAGRARRVRAARRRAGRRGSRRRRNALPVPPRARPPGARPTTCRRIAVCGCTATPPGGWSTAGAAPELIADHWLKGERPAEAVDVAAGRRAPRGRRRRLRRRARRRSSACSTEAPAHHDGLCLRAEILDALGDGRAPERLRRRGRRASASPRPRSCGRARRSRS